MCLCGTTILVNSVYIKKQEKVFTASKYVPVGPLYGLYALNL